MKKALSQMTFYSLLPILLFFFFPLKKIKNHGNIAEDWLKNEKFYSGEKRIKLKVKRKNKQKEKFRSHQSQTRVKGKSHQLAL